MYRWLPGYLQCFLNPVCYKFDKLMYTQTDYPSVQQQMNMFCIHTAKQAVVMQGDIMIGTGKGFTKSSTAAHYCLRPDH